jgi:hypothetical protein
MTYLVDFGYQGCIGYYLHRCMPKEGDFDNILQGVTPAAKNVVRANIVLLSWVILEIACFIFDRKTVKDAKKPIYNYRGCTEVYFSYLFWILLKNDVPYNEPNGTVPRMVEFCQFHRYLFSEVFETLVRSEPKFASCLEISDIIFKCSENENTPSILGIQGGTTQCTADEAIKHLILSIEGFYEDYLHPYYSRHFAGLMPVQIDDARILDKHIYAFNMLPSLDDVAMVVSHAQKGTTGDIDTFIDNVGVHCTLSKWQRELESAPNSTYKKVGEMIDAMTLNEYSHVTHSATMGRGQPKISVRVAEAMYLLCNVLTIPSEPNSEEELALLRIADKCSCYKAFPRLLRIGAFDDNNL